MAPIVYNRTKTTEFFYKMNFLLYLFGFPNFWIEDLKLSRIFIKLYNYFNIFISIGIFIYVGSETGALFTQHNLTKKQFCNLILDVISHISVKAFHSILCHHKDTIKEAFYILAVTLKRISNDPKVEKQMIAKTSAYIVVFLSMCISSRAMRTFDGFMDVMYNNSTFSASITAYPDVQDDSVMANTVRAIFCVTWYFLFFRAFGSYILLLCLTNSLSHQYRNLHIYFCGLSKIFQRNDLNQNEKEKEYVEQFKIGVESHIEIIRATALCQTACGAVFSGQIIFNITAILANLIQIMQSGRDLSNLSTALLTAIAILISTGIIMWNAGDITVEADDLPTAIYFSGWENCQGRSSIRIRKLATIAMNHAQVPVTLKGLGYITLSYQSYVTIVKASYSLFSVLAET